MNNKTSNNKTNVFTIVELPTSPKLRRTSLVQSGFTIVELLVVIVVIGILAAITIVSYTGISQRAIAVSLQSDLTNASKQLKLFQVENSAYPTTISCAIPDSSTNK
ncbi:MAG TPA: prepilin-type N-terminal cleavage/methylation domain-containing protein, partial [Candidatus Angelobacter sp.]|nr:prepilin-type N-terminal cleavage/methylation domain-containing protein [Candidatus Angelobacter sp.]